MLTLASRPANHIAPNCRHAWSRQPWRVAVAVHGVVEAYNPRLLVVLYWWGGSEGGAWGIWLEAAVALVDRMTRSGQVGDLSTLIRREFISRYSLYMTPFTESLHSPAKRCGQQVMVAGWILYWCPRSDYDNLSTYFHRVAVTAALYCTVAYWAFSERSLTPCYQLSHEMHEQCMKCH